MPITSGHNAVTTDTRFARITAENPAKGITLDELEALVAAARDANVPGGSPVEGFGPFSLFGVATPTTAIQVKAVVTVEGE